MLTFSDFEKSTRAARPLADFDSNPPYFSRKTSGQGFGGEFRGRALLERPGLRARATSFFWCARTTISTNRAESRGGDDFPGRFGRGDCLRCVHSTSKSGRVSFGNPLLALFSGVCPRPSYVPRCVHVDVRSGVGSRTAKQKSLLQTARAHTTCARSQGKKFPDRELSPIRPSAST